MEKVCDSEIMLFFLAYHFSLSCFMLLMPWDLEVGQLALERNASPIQWTGGLGFFLLLGRN